MARRKPLLDRLLRQAQSDPSRPIALVLAGHNGSGKSTLWYEQLAGKLRLPLINADRLTASILPPTDAASPRLPAWAQELRDDDERWQRLSQEGVRVFKSLVMNERMPFAFETVFSHWQRRADGSHASKTDDIAQMQQAGYFVVLLFVGLSSAKLSVLRVMARKQQGGHGVPMDKLLERYPRTQAAVGHAATVADMTLMFDNSRSRDKAFTLVRAQRRSEVLFDSRDPQRRAEAGLRFASDPWLLKVVGPYPAVAAESTLKLKPSTAALRDKPARRLKRAKATDAAIATPLEPQPKPQRKAR